MLLTSVVIVLREVLEAALLISILLATSRRLGLNSRWLKISLVIGLIGATVYAHFLGPISALFGGFGQELVNATLHLLVFLTLIVIVFLVARHHGHARVTDRLLPLMMAAAVAVATAQEGSEIIVYVTGFLQVSGFLGSVGIGSLTGAGIGLSVGIFFYYLLLSLPYQRAHWISLALLGVAAASMSAQVSTMLIQADFLSAAGPVWDTSWLVDEQSLPGQLLFALVGYESTPSLVEVVIYAASLLVVIAAVLLGRTVMYDRDGESL